MRSILVVDDDPQLRRMIRITLERAGYAVDEAENGAVAMHKVRAQPPDLVITDIVMPHKEGIETIAELKRDHPKVKVIAISGGGRIEARQYLGVAAQIGADKTFGKPVERELLLAAVEELLGGREP